MILVGLVAGIPEGVFSSRPASYLQPLARPCCRGTRFGLVSYGCYSSSRPVAMAYLTVACTASMSGVHFSGSEGAFLRRWKARQPVLVPVSLLHFYPLRNPPCASK